jgi:hypothetical protein
MTPSTRSARTGLGSGRALSLVLGLVAVASLDSCAPAPERFARSFESPRALAEEFLRALESKDRGRLESLALTREEFKTEAYPEMPAYGSVPAEFAWSQLALKSSHGLANVLAMHGGRAYELVDLSYRGGHTAYRTFVVHRRAMLRVRDRKSGEEATLALFGSVLEHRGRFKLFSFNIER